MPTPEDYLRLAVGSTPRSLLPPSAPGDLLRLAARWPLSQELLVECRLGTHPGRPDLSLVYRGAEEHALLSQRLALQPQRDRGSRDGTHSLRALIAASSVYPGEKGEPLALWIEADAEHQPGEPAAPAVFFRFTPHQVARTNDPDTSLAAMRADLEAMLARLAHRLWPSMRLATKRLLASVPRFATVGHAGMMWSRNPPTLRITIGGLDLDSARAFLNAYPPPPHGLPENAVPLGFGLGLRPVLCIDIGADGKASVSGIELFPQRDRDAGPPLSHALEELFRHGLCTEIQRAELDQWQAEITPINASAPWPEDLVIESLRRPPTEFSLVRTGINHLKLVASRDGAVLAKVYLRVAHEWVRFEPVTAETPPS